MTSFCQTNKNKARWDRVKLKSVLFYRLVAHEDISLNSIHPHPLCVCSTCSVRTSPATLNWRWTSLQWAIGQPTSRWKCTCRLRLANIDIFVTCSGFLLFSPPTATFHAVNTPRAALSHTSYLCPDGAIARDLQDLLPGQTQRQETAVAVNTRPLCAEGRI